LLIFSLKSVEIFGWPCIISLNSRTQNPKFKILTDSES
jgi:hypothetical protein